MSLNAFYIVKVGSVLQSYWRQWCVCVWCHSFLIHAVSPAEHYIWCLIKQVRLKEKTYHSGVLTHTYKQWRGSISRGTRSLIAELLLKDADFSDWFLKKKSYYSLWTVVSVSDRDVFWLGQKDCYHSICFSHYCCVAFDSHLNLS